MVIKASKILIFIRQFIAMFIISILCMSILLSFEYKLLSIQEVVFVGGLISFGISMLDAFSNAYDIEVDEGSEIVGGPALKLIGPWKRQFVSSVTIDMERSKKRNWLDSVLGVVKIYDINGRGFKIIKPYFYKRDLDNIKNILKNVIGIQLS